MWVSSQDNITWTITISGFATAGTVTASLDAGIATNVANHANLASTSTDNTVTVGEAVLSNIVVTTDSDVVDSTDGVTSLREAIACANNHIGNETITFDGSLAGQTITLIDGQLKLSDTTGTTTINGLGLRSIGDQRQQRFESVLHR